jgi:hypothetical protein
MIPDDRIARHGNLSAGRGRPCEDAISGSLIGGAAAAEQEACDYDWKIVIHSLAAFVSTFKFRLHDRAALEQAPRPPDLLPELFTRRHSR